MCSWKSYVEHLAINIYGVGCSGSCCARYCVHRSSYRWKPTPSLGFKLHIYARLHRHERKAFTFEQSAWSMWMLHVYLCVSLCTLNVCQDRASHISVSCINATSFGIRRGKPSSGENCSATFTKSLQRSSPWEVWIFHMHFSNVLLARKRWTYPIFSMSKGAPRQFTFFL